MFHHPVFVDIITTAEYHNTIYRSCHPDGLIAQLRNLYKTMLSKK